MLLSTVNFFAIGFLFSTLIDWLVVDWRAGLWEQAFMRLGVGLGMVSVVGVLLNLLGLPVDWRLMYLIGGCLAIAGLIKRHNTGRLSFGLGPSSFGSRLNGLLFLLLLILTGIMYFKGSFSYYWLEDGDAWEYAVSSQYIAEHKTFSAPYKFGDTIEPYPQGYSILMGLMRQTGDSIRLTLKFFNALLVTIALGFVFFFVKRFSGRDSVALAATAVLFAVPAWVSHFIYALTYNMVMTVVFFYCLAMMQRTRPESGWKYISLLVYGALWLNHLSSAVTTTIFVLLLLGIKTLEEERLPEEYFQVLAGGFGVGLLMYGPAYWRHWDVVVDGLADGREYGGLQGLFDLLTRASTSAGLAVVLAGCGGLAMVYWTRNRWFPRLARVLFGGGEAGKRIVCLAGWLGFLVLLLWPARFLEIRTEDDCVVTWREYLLPAFDNFANNPIGIGYLFLPMALLGVLLALLAWQDLLRPKASWLHIALAWFVMALLLTLSGSFSITLIPLRSWAYLGLFVSILAGYAVVRCLEFVSRPWVRALFIVCLVVLGYQSAYRVKCFVNAGPVWRDAPVRYPESHKLYQWMDRGGIEQGAKVVDLCADSGFLVTFGASLAPLLVPIFNPENLHSAEPFYQRALERSPAENHLILKEQGVEYVTLGGSCLARRRDAGPVYIEKMTRYVNALDRSAHLRQIIQDTGQGNLIDDPAFQNGHDRRLAATGPSNSHST